MAVAATCPQCGRRIPNCKSGKPKLVDCPNCTQLLQQFDPAATGNAPAEPLAPPAGTQPASVVRLPLPRRSRMPYAWIAGAAVAVAIPLALGAAWMAGAAKFLPTPFAGKAGSELALAELDVRTPQLPAAKVPQRILLGSVADKLPEGGEVAVGAKPAPAGRPDKIVIKRRDLASEEELRKQLLKAPEVNVDVPKAEGRTSALILQTATRLQPNQPAHFTPALLVKRADMAGLPFVMGADCQLGKEPAENLHAQSKKLRAIMAEANNDGKQAGPPGPMGPGGRPDPNLAAAFAGARRRPPGNADPRPPSDKIRDKLGDEANRKDFQSEGAVPCLMQMLSPENRPMRKIMVDELSHIEHRRASEALASIALFDLSDEVRALAVQALNSRPREEYREVLLSGFRYVWAPVADHAAEALVALQDTEAMPSMSQMAEMPDPSAGSYDSKDNTYKYPELVRVNHLSNCLMCHAPSNSPQDLVRARIPSPKEPINQTGKGGGYSGDKPGNFVRADITYLRQNFSVYQPVEYPGLWPATQRYDYLVRLRKPKTEAETAALKEKRAAYNTTYPQREALQYALTELKSLGVSASE